MKQLLLVCFLVTFTLSSSFAQYSDGENDEAFRTQTIGGWGATPSGDNPGAYLHAHFDQVFSAGLVIGSGQNTLTFTSAEAITKYLPASGKSTALDGAYIDPLKAEVRNTLAAQAIATTISLAFDAAIKDYAASDLNLANMEVAVGTFEGMLVKEVLAEANKVLGGEESEFTAAQLNEALTEVNQSYVDGEYTGTGYLTVSAKTLSIKTVTLDAVKIEAIQKESLQTLERQ